LESARQIAAVLVLFTVVFAMPAAASEEFAYTLQTSPGSVVFQVRCPDPSPRFRTFVLDHPRQYVADVTTKGSVSLRAPQTIPLAGESPLKEIRIASHRNFLRLFFQLPDGRKIVRNVRRDGAHLVFSFAYPEIPATAPPMAFPSPSRAPALAAAIPAPGAVTSGPASVVPAPTTVVPAKAGTQESRTAAETPSPPEPRTPTLEPPHLGSRNTSSAAPPPASPLLTFHTADAPAIPAVALKQGKAPSNSRSSLPNSTRIDGFLEMRGAADTHRDDSLEHTQAFRKRFQVETKIPLARDAGKVFAVVSGRSDLLWFGTRSDWNDWDLDLHEAYLHWSDGPLEVRLGKQIVRWGKTDQLSPVDVLNPEDLREGITWETEERKIPVWMARMKTFRGPFSLEGVLVPIFEPHDMNIFGTDWAVFRHLKGAVADDPLVPDIVKDAVDGIEARRREPARTLENVQWGTRLTARTHDWDLAVSAFQGFDPTPHITRFPIRNIRVDGTFSRESIESALSTGVFTGEDVEVRYKRFRMIGFDFETTWKDLGLRGEAAYFSDRAFLTDSLTSSTRPVFFGVLGADYAGPDGWYANLQLAFERIGGDTDRILYFEKENLSLNGEVSKELLRGDLEARLRFLLMLTDGGSYWNPSLTYLRFRPLSLTFGLNLFAGPADTFLGFFRENDQAVVSVRYDF
jgi:hypothetical protein